ncbi:MAG: hypothetical protein ACJA13_004131 [Paraglaciecola sp.]|jgi:hypothetical protein
MWGVYSKVMMAGAMITPCHYHIDFITKSNVTTCHQVPHLYLYT